MVRAFFNGNFDIKKKIIIKKDIQNVGEDSGAKDEHLQKILRKAEKEVEKHGVEPAAPPNEPNLIDTKSVYDNTDKMLIKIDNKINNANYRRGASTRGRTYPYKHIRLSYKNAIITLFYTLRIDRKLWH